MPTLWSAKDLSMEISLAFISFVTQTMKDEFLNTDKDKNKLSDGKIPHYTVLARSLSQTSFEPGPNNVAFERESI